MARLLRHGSARILAGCACAALVAAAVVFSAAAQDKKTCELCFAPPDSAVFHYKIFSQDDQNFHGMSATLNQTAEVDLMCAGKTEEGHTVVDIRFKKITSSLVSNNQLMDWEPPVKLEGRTIRATISRKGRIVDAKAMGNIPGLATAEDIREIVEPWFIRLPDTTFAVGDTWAREIREGVKEGKEPERAGTGIYTLKKLDKKGDVNTAVVEAKITTALNKETPVGMLVGAEKTDLKATVAVGSGHIIEIKRVIEIKGEVVVRDEITNKEKKRKTVFISTYEGKLQ